MSGSHPMFLITLWHHTISGLKSFIFLRSFRHVAILKNVFMRPAYDSFFALQNFSTTKPCCSKSFVASSINTSTHQILIEKSLTMRMRFACPARLFTCEIQASVLYAASPSCSGPIGNSCFALLFLMMVDTKENNFSS